MQTINLKKYYYPLFTKDTFVEVSDEVAEALLLMHREENNRIRKMYYHKAYFSLDREDGIENDAVCGFEKSPEEILMEQEEERFFQLTLERLNKALSCLTETQQRRIRARYLSGRTMQDIAASEGVSVSVVSESIRSGLKKLQNPEERDKSLVYKGALIHRSGVCALPGGVAYFVRNGELHFPNPLCAPRSMTPALRLSCSTEPDISPPKGGLTYGDFSLSHFNHPTEQRPVCRSRRRLSKRHEADK